MSAVSDDVAACLPPPIDPMDVSTLFAAVEMCHASDDAVQALKYLALSGNDAGLRHALRTRVRCAALEGYWTGMKVRR